MSSLSRIAKQVVQTAKSLKVVSTSAHAKWAALLASRPSYTLFENPPNHPYTVLVQSAEQLEIQFEKIIAALLDLEIGSGTLREELDKIQGFKVYDEVELDSDVERLRFIASDGTTAVTAEMIAEEAMRLYYTCVMVSDAVKLKYIKDELAEMHKKKYIVNHIEKPFLNITLECRNAVKEVKSMCNLLMALTIDGVHVASQVDASRAPKFLKLRLN
jgi:hypothetical protein